MHGVHVLAPPNARRGGCDARAVWLVILVAVAKQDHERTACVFAMSRSNVAFAPLRGDACVVASTDAGVFGDGPIPIGAETKALLCVVNAVGVRVKVQLVAKGADDVFSVRTSPSVVTLSKEKACLLRTHGDAEVQHPWHPRGDGDDIEKEWFDLNLTCRQKRLP